MTRQACGTASIDSSPTRLRWRLSFGTNGAGSAGCCGQRQEKTSARGDQHACPRSSLECAGLRRPSRIGRRGPRTCAPATADTPPTSEDRAQPTALLSARRRFCERAEDDQRCRFSRDGTGAPQLDRPDGDIPFELATEDITVGDGAEATAGKKVSVHYVGVAFSTGEEFDASWNRGRPFEFKLGKGQVIPGWDRGVEGMKVGGRRKLTIPSAMAYGARGAGGVIAPHEPLVFVVDLLSVD